MPNILINNNFYISTSSACINDTTPPTFSGIGSLDVESRGQIRASWSAGSDATSPIRYEVYIKASTNVGLFSLSNIVAVTPNLQYDIFTLPDGSFLSNGTTYYVGVRAIDGVSNRDSNTVSSSVISTGVLTSIDIYKNEGVFSIDSSNNFLGSFWSTKNGNIAVPPGAVLGSASYQVYDKSGAAVVGMSGSGLSADSNGMYHISGIPNLLAESLRHATIKIVISVDSENRVNILPITDEKPSYKIEHVFSINNNNQLTGSFWILDNEKLLTSNLGSASYSVYDSSNVVVSGLSELGLSSVSGVYTITPVSLPSGFDPNKNYIIKISLTANGTNRTHYGSLLGSTPEYSSHAIFSINGLNQLEATLWATIDGEKANNSVLGTASYAIYDKTGAAVVGLSESGIAPDSNSLFHTTAASATLLTDLTHYVAKITIIVAGQQIVSYKGFTLLGN